MQIYSIESCNLSVELYLPFLRGDAFACKKSFGAPTTLKHLIFGTKILNTDLDFERRGRDALMAHSWIASNRGDNLDLGLFMKLSLSVVGPLTRYVD